MHMTCFKCQHDFCWMCLKEWKSHNEKYFFRSKRYRTGGYFRCNVFTVDEAELKKKSAKEQDMKRLEFYMDRYFVHKNSYKLNKDAVKDYRNIFKGRQFATATKKNDERRQKDLLAKMVQA
jgi:hypothetical protein